jgi:hypothetical protein
MMKSSGPQYRQDLRRECRDQAVPYDNLLFAAAIDQLLSAGEIVIDDDGTDDRNTCFDLPESYYNTLIA